MFPVDLGVEYLYREEEEEKEGTQVDANIMCITQFDARCGRRQDA